MDSLFCKELTQEETKNILDNNLKVVLIDIRSPMDYNERHITRAINIPYRYAYKNITNNYTNLHQPIILYCVSGINSEELAIRLTKFGYLNIYNLPFGIIDWKYEITVG